MGGMVRCLFNLYLRASIFLLFHMDLLNSGVENSLSEDMQRLLCLMVQQDDIRTFKRVPDDVQRELDDDWKGVLIGKFFKLLSK